MWRRYVKKRSAASVRGLLGMVPNQAVEALRGGAPVIWLHAVSVGETIASRPVARALKEALPQCKIGLSVTTDTGFETAQSALKAGEVDALFFFPMDLPMLCGRALHAVRPDVFMMMETELWLNFLYCAKVYDARTVVVNGRISDKSFELSRRLRGYYRALFEHLDLAGVQSEVEKVRFQSLGAQNVEVLGNVKFDQALEGIDADPVSWMNSLGFSSDRLTIVVGSTRGDEEEDWVLKALRDVGLDKLNVLFAPRHMERVPRQSADRAAARVHEIRRGLLVVRVP